MHENAMDRLGAVNRARRGRKLGRMQEKRPCLLTTETAVGAHLFLECSDLVGIRPVCSIDHHVGDVAERVRPTNQVQ